MINKIEDAKETIRQAIEMTDEDLPLVILFSGGKDSMACLLLASEITRNLLAVYMRSGIDLPGAVEFAQRSAEHFHVPFMTTNPYDYLGDLAHLVREKKQWPTVENPWCSGRLKVRPLRKKLRELWGFKEIAKVCGVRRFESTRRMKMYGQGKTITNDPEHSHSLLVYPILEFTEMDVLSYLGHYSDLPTKSPLYDRVGVSGCYWCPFYQESIIERVARTWPGIYSELIEVEREIGKPSLNGNKYLRNVIERVEAQLPLNLI